MKNLFPEYYRVNKKDLQERFKDLVFVFDANVLLDIFRLDQSITKEIFDVIKRYSSQIVIPYHAAEEYNKKIHIVLLQQLEKIVAAQKAFDGFVQLLEAKRNQPYISSSSNEKLKDLKDSIQQDFDIQSKYLQEQLLHGELQNKMSLLLEGKVLAPFTVDEIETIKKEGENRYNNKIPPGWKDNTKGENSYGDLINWKEILRFAKDNQKSVVFVTSDQKEDWVYKYNGMTVCPHYELLREFHQSVGNTKLIFHIYTLDRFLKFVHDQDETLISEGTVKQVRDILGDLQQPNIANTISKFQESLKSITETSRKYREYTELMNKIQSMNNVKKMSGECVEQDKSADVLDNQGDISPAENKAL